METLPPSKCILCTPSPREDASGEKTRSSIAEAPPPSSRLLGASATCGYSNHIPSEAEVSRGESGHQGCWYSCRKQPHANLFPHLYGLFCLVLSHQQVGKDSCFAILEIRKSKARLTAFHGYARVPRADKLNFG